MTEIQNASMAWCVFIDNHKLSMEALTIHYFFFPSHVRFVLDTSLRLFLNKSDFLLIQKWKRIPCNNYKCSYCWSHWIVLGFAQMPGPPTLSWIPLTIQWLKMDFPVIIDIVMRGNLDSTKMHEIDCFECKNDTFKVNTKNSFESKLIQISSKQKIENFFLRYIVFLSFTFHNPQFNISLNSMSQLYWKYI